LQQLGQTCPGLVRLGWLGHAGPGAQTRPKSPICVNLDRAKVIQRTPHAAMPEDGKARWRPMPDDGKARRRPLTHGDGP